MQAGSGVVFTYLFHCVVQGSCYLVCSNNTQHLTHVVKDTSDLIIAFNSPSFVSFGPVTKTAEMYKLQRSKEAFKTLFSTESVTFIT